MDPKHPSHSPLFPARALRYAWLVAIGAVIGAVWAYVVALRQPVEYISTARMFVSGRVNIPEASNAYSEELANYLGTQVEIMRSQEVGYRARQRVSLEQPTLKGDARLDIRVLPGTSIFNLSATGGDPVYTRAYLDAVTIEFSQFKRERRMVSSQATIEQISTELTRLEKEINTQEQSLLRFKERNNVNFWEQQLVASARFLADLKSREAALNMQLSIMDSWERTAAERGLAGNAEIGETGAVSVSSSPELSQTRQRLDTLTIEREELQQVLRPAHPKLKRLDEEISRLQKVIALGVSKSHERRKERRAAMQSELEGLAKAITEWDSKSLESSRIEAEYQRLRGALERTRELYNRMLGSLQNLDTRKSVDQELVQTLQTASPAAPVDARVRSRILSGMFIGSLCGLGLLIVATRFDDRSHSIEETLERLNSRSFGEVPQRPSGPVSATRAKFIEAAFEEAFRRLRSLLLLGLPAGKVPVFLVTSALPSEGKSEIAINLARAYARIGRKVLLIDADLRRGRIHRALSEGDVTPGFAELIRREASEEQVIRTTTEPNLSLVTNGHAGSQASELLSTGNLSGVLESFARRFDLIVIDSAPIGPVDDTNHLVPFATRTLFVVRMRHTLVRHALKSINTLKARGVSDVGVVFNRVRQEGGRYYSSYYNR